MEVQMEELGPGDGPGQSASAASVPAAAPSGAAPSGAAHSAAAGVPRSTQAVVEEEPEGTSNPSRYVSHHALLNTNNP